jgi:hypothetical protein
MTQRPQRALRALLSPALLSPALLSATLLTPAQSHAFGGLIAAAKGGTLSEVSAEVAIMGRDERAVMSLSVSYAGGAQGVAIVIPVPGDLELAQVKTLPRQLFDRLDLLSAPRVSEYWEQDPCYRAPGQETKSFEFGEAEVELSAGKGSIASLFQPQPGASFLSGEYTLTLLSPDESSDPAAALSARGYALPEGGAAALTEILNGTLKGERPRALLVAAVDPKRVKRDAKGVASLPPLRFEVSAARGLTLPVGPAPLSAPGGVRLTAYVISPEGRHEPSSAPSAFVPSNLEVTPMPLADLSGLHARLVSETLALQGGRGAVTEYAWAAGTCDPCVTPALTAVELKTLGGDLLAEKADDLGAWVVTRLAARAEAGVVDDIALRAVSPVSGGRGEAEDLTPAGAVEVTAENSFQSRYVMRHRWAKPSKCKEKRAGVWGGAPIKGGEVGAPPAPRALGGVGRAAPAGVLAERVRTPLKAYGVSGADAGAQGNTKKTRGR